MKTATAYKLGNRVIIRSNPFHAAAEDVGGTIINFRPGAGFGGCDIVDVRYALADGSVHTLPFGAHNLEPASRVALLELAAFHGGLAAKYRNEAEQCED